MKEKRLNVIMNKNEFDEFSKALDDNSFEQYAQEYINKHRNDQDNLTSDDVLTLALIYALQNAHDSVQRILSVPYNENIFTTLDQSGYNAIYLLFDRYSGRGEEEGIRGLVLGHLTKKEVTKVDLNGSIFVELYYAMTAPLFCEMATPDQLEYSLQFLRHIYTAESLEQFRSIVLNEEFNLNQYEALGHEKYFEEFNKNTDSFLDPEDLSPEVPHHSSVTDETKQKYDMRNDANGGSFTDKFYSEKLNSPQMNQIWWDI